MEKYVLDIIFLIILILSVVLSAKKGFLLTILTFVSSVVSIILSKVLSSPVSVWIYDSFARERVLVKVQSFLPEQLTSGDAQTIWNGVLEQLPDGLVAIADKYGLLPQTIPAIDNVADFFSMENLEQSYIRPFCLALLSVFCMAGLFYIISLVLNLIARMINRLMHKEGKSHPVNAALGGALGLIRGLIPVIVLSLLLNFASDYHLNDTLTNAVENSYVCKIAGKITEDVYAKWSAYEPETETEMQEDFQIEIQ